MVLNKLMVMGIVLVSMPVFALPVVFAQGPTLQSTRPISNATGVALTSTVTATYDRNMDSTTVTSRTFAVHAMQSGWLTETLSVSGGDITLSPRNAFKPGELVQVSATTGTLSISGTGPVAPYVWQFRTAAGVGPATFPISSTFGAGNSYAVALGDLDGDGDLDALIANYNGAQEVWLNDGTGNFGTTAYTTFGGGYSTSVALGDLDGDGDLDALIANINGAQEVWLNDGTGKFGTAAYDTFGGGFSISAALGDVDGDGNLDALIANINGQAQEVWLNDGTGNFGTAAYTTFGAGDSWSVALGDLDGDGDLDAVIANLSAAQEVWLNDGTGNFGTAAYDTFGGGNSQSVALGDLDGDGDSDALIANYDAAQEVWLNDGPEMDVQGNGQSIPAGAAAPTPANGTGFGSMMVGSAPVTHTFTISNAGNFDLTLTGSPAVTLTGGTPFSVTVQPSSPVISHSVTTFAVTFAPITPGSFTDTVIIPNNDSNEKPVHLCHIGDGGAPNIHPDGQHHRQRARGFSAARHA